MITKTQVRKRLSVAILLVALLCTACGAKKAESTSTNSLLTLLAGIPQDPISHMENFIYFLDYSAVESAYNATRPPDAEVFANLSESDKSYTVWWVVLRATQGLLGETWFQLETMQETVGFNTLDVDQVIEFGAGISRGLILTGSFDADAISAAYKTNLGLAANDFDGNTIWCWAEDCADGGQSDPRYRFRENPFGGSLGQRQPMIINNDLLMASADLDLVLGHLDAIAGTQPSLADDPEVQAAVNAVSQDADILQAMIANSTIVERIANKLPIDDRLSPEMRSTAQETLLENFQELPLYEMLILADAVTEDEQIARLGIVYKDADSAETAAPILLDRLANHQSVQTRLPFAEMLVQRNVTDPRYYVHQEANRAVLVLEFPTKKASSDEIVQMLGIDYRGSTTPPGLVYRLFLDMFNADDTGWLSTATRAELEAIQVGTLIGVEVTMGLSDIADGALDKANFGGIVTVELDDGTEVKAIWDKSLGDQFIGGMKLEIAPTSDPEFWKVLRIVETP